VQSYPQSVHRLQSYPQSIHSTVLVHVNANENDSYSARTMLVQKV